MSMSKDEVIKRLRESNRAEVSRRTGLPYRYLRHLIEENIENPGSRQMDLLRDYFGRENPQ